MLYKIASFNVWVRYFVWNFKGYLWNSTLNILPIHWQMWILFTGEKLSALRFKSLYVFLKRPLFPKDVYISCAHIEDVFFKEVSHLCAHIRLFLPIWSWTNAMHCLSSYALIDLEHSMISYSLGLIINGMCSHSKLIESYIDGGNSGLSPVAIWTKIYSFYSDCLCVTITSVSRT